MTEHTPSITLIVMGGMAMFFGGLLWDIVKCSDSPYKKSGYVAAGALALIGYLMLLDPVISRILP